MERSEKMKRLRARLIKRRDELFELHRNAEETQRSLAERDIEPEEKAQKESSAELLEHLDDQEREEMRAIDHALSIMETGRYGFCEVCGKPITIKRLEAIPWTVLCGKHAQ
jgi:DnaK suppressor protein